MLGMDGMDLSFPTEINALPSDIQAFLDEADRRIERFQLDRNIPGFVPSDYARVFMTLQRLVESDLARGERFCEWGSGFGVVACLAGMLGFDAYGIEIEGKLVDAAREIAADFDVCVEFIEGSFISMESAARIGPNERFAWLTTQQIPGLGLDLSPADFDVIYAYPWPDEETLIGALFECHAEVGALLLTYHADGNLRLRRRQQKKRRRLPTSG